MLKLIYVSQWGGMLDLANNDLFTLTNVDGLTTAATNISSLVIGGIDGDQITNIQAQPRGIIFDLRINNGVNVETAKRAVLNIVKLKQNCSIEWTQNNRTFIIKGVVDAVDMPRFNNDVTMQISIHCEAPFWEDIADTVQQINDSLPLHYFTAENDTSSFMLYFPEDGRPLSEYNATRSRTINNAGDVAVGMIIEVLAIDTVVNPKIYDQNGNFFGVGYGTTKRVEMQAGDIIRINTNSGELAVIKNKNTNLINYVAPKSTWLKLQAGENTFRIECAESTDDNVTFSIVYKQRYI